MYTDCIASFLCGGLSNHSTTLINTCVVPISPKAPFKVFNFLLYHPQSHDCLVIGWFTPLIYKGIGGIWDKLKVVKQVLKAGLLP